MKYESNILKRLIDTYGVIGNPRYLSEIIKEFIVRGKELYPQLFTYQADWLAHIDEFGLTPDYVVSYTGQHIYAPHTKERPVKRAILKGQTLVNLFEEVRRETRVNEVYRFFKVIGNQVPTLKPNTKYTLIFDKYVEGVSTAIYKNHSASLMTDYYTFGKSFCFTTIEDVGTEFHIFIKGETVEIAEQMLKLNPKIVILEGDYTNIDIPYFEGMQSVKMPVLTTTGKNLANQLLPLDSSGANVTSTKIENSSKVLSSLIKIHPNQRIVISKNNAGSRFRCFFFDRYPVVSKTTSIGGLYADIGTTIKVTSPVNSEYLLVVWCEDKNTEYPINYQVEYGSEKTDWEPFKSNILTVSEDVTLRGVGDVQDTLDLLTGEVTERIGEIVLDGSENWSRQGVSQNNSDLGIYYSTTALPNTIFNTNNVLCDKFKTSKTLAWHSSEEDIYVSISNYGLKICFDERKLESTTVEGFKKWLSENTPTIQYPLVEKPIKTVDLTIHDKDQQKVEQLTSFEGGTHFTTSSQEGSLLPTITVDVVTDLEETLNLCSMDGNTL